MSGSATIEPDDWASGGLAEARARVYGFLAQIFLFPPSKLTLAKLQDEAFIGDLAAGVGARNTPELASISKAAQADPDALAQEYHDLFVVPLGNYVAPYEAVYRDAQEVDGRWMGGLLQGECTLAVQAKYRAAGVSIGEGYLDLPDHVGLELSFMQFVCEKEQNAWRDGDRGEAMRLTDVQADFLNEHLGVWVPDLCHRIEMKAPGPLYKGLAQLTVAFIAADREMLSKNLELARP